MPMKLAMLAGSSAELPRPAPWRRVLVRAQGGYQHLMAVADHNEGPAAVLQQPLQRLPIRRSFGGVECPSTRRGTCSSASVGDRFQPCEGTTCRSVTASGWLFPKPSKAQVASDPDFADVVHQTVAREATEGPVGGGT
ncbi:hypothetical protein SALBM311S_03824 [Streptomyces alboniger]